MRTPKSASAEGARVPAASPGLATDPSVGRPAGSGGVLPPGLVGALSAAGVGLMTDPDVLAGHGVDWTGRWRGPVLGLVRPRSTAQVAAVLAAARTHRVPVQVQGGSTGLVGGSVPDRPALVLLTTGLDVLAPGDGGERTVIAGAGATLSRLQGHARAAGLWFGVDLAARASATVGGMAATNAGGLGVCAHGMMRDNVRGLTAVLPDGRIVRTTGRPRKDNTGYDLTDLLIGAEGTLGVITEVEVVLVPAPAPSTVGLLAVGDLTEAVEAARAVQATGSLVLAAEVVDAPGVVRAAAALGVPDPLPKDARWMLLLEVADGGSADGLAPVADAVAAVATSAPDRERLWSYREHQTELYARLPAPGPEKLDVSVRLERLDAAVAAIRAVVAESTVGTDGRSWVGFFGHALDGNLHVQLIDAPPGTAERVLETVAEHGGSVSAEHGIGRLKAPYLHLARSADEIAWMRQLRATVDPDGLLNAGVLFTD